MNTDARRSDILERACDQVEDWVFICPDGKIANALARVGEYGLLASPWMDHVPKGSLRGGTSSSSLRDT
ncbi:MAG: hypothetical protein ACLQGP_19165 [Isosphaeraceae bacterium]